MNTTIGNDLIDLGAAHNRGRADQAKFLARILTAAEQAQMAAQHAGDLGFARLWSAKEAAYKAAKKHQPALVFAPRRWQVAIDALDDPATELDGQVRIDPDTRVNVHWRLGPGWLHCIAVLGPAPGELAQAVAACAEPAPEAVFSAREREGFSRGESAGVRTLAKRLLRQHGIDGVEILRPVDGQTRLPPRVFAHGQPLPDLDISLSHDGAWLAAVIALA
ncbi:MAG: 4'-phosphopantetheinyl transferase superfamily protein [Lysobacterales bacterium]